MPPRSGGRGACFPTSKCVLPDRTAAPDSGCLCGAHESAFRFEDYDLLTLGSRGRGASMGERNTEWLPPVHPGEGTRNVGVCPEPNGQPLVQGNRSSPRSHTGQG